MIIATKTTKKQTTRPKANFKNTDKMDRAKTVRGYYNVDENIHKFFTRLFGLSFCHHIGDSHFNFMV